MKTVKIILGVALILLGIALAIYFGLVVLWGVVKAALLASPVAAFFFYVLGGAGGALIAST